MRGDPCGAPARLVKDGHCDAHRPGGRSEMSRRGLMGALRQGKGMGLDPDELPELLTHEDLKKRLDLICRAVLAKQIGDREAQAAIRAVEAWLKAEGDRLTVHVVEELKVEVTRLKAEVRGKDKLRAM